MREIWQHNVKTKNPGTRFYVNMSLWEVSLVHLFHSLQSFKGRKRKKKAVSRFKLLPALLRRNRRTDELKSLREITFCIFLLLKPTLVKICWPVSASPSSPWRPDPIKKLPREFKSETSESQENQRQLAKLCGGSKRCEDEPELRRPPPFHLQALITAPGSAGVEKSC